MEGNKYFTGCLATELNGCKGPNIGRIAELSELGEESGAFEKE